MFRNIKLNISFVSHLVNCSVLVKKLKAYSFLLIIIVCAVNQNVSAQNGTITGLITSNSGPAPYVTVMLKGTSLGALTDTSGKFTIPDVPASEYMLIVNGIGFTKATQNIKIKAGETLYIKKVIESNGVEAREVVVTGTMKETYTLQSPIKVEVFKAEYLQKNKTPSLFESLSLVNGVQPQLNCGVCGTGDIHINGLEGPYTIVLIDGMPIVSSLSTVYGFSGIPNSLIERVEVVKGPASTLYGSEAVAGVVNIITKNPYNAPKFVADIYATSHFEKNADLAYKFGSEKAQSLLSVNYFKADKTFDKNGDGFTDFPLADRVSVFNKWNFHRKNERTASLAARYYYEDRFGGQTNWTPKFRGSDSVYGESIYTNRYEVIGSYQLPVNKERLFVNFSFNRHEQNSFYGKTSFNANQTVLFGQLLWDKKFGAHDFLTGLTTRFNNYDDNTTATKAPVNTTTPGLFLQDEIKINAKTTTLVGARYDYDHNHGSIFSPRLSLKYSPNSFNTFRVSAGNGFRVVNIFTEDHAALTGARTVILAGKLKPETSYNFTASYNKFINLKRGFYKFDVDAFYTYFTNKIIPDYETDVNLIIYDNIQGHAISRGISINNEISFAFPLRARVGATLMEVFEIEDLGDEKIKTPQLFAPAISGVFTITYTHPKWKTVLDYTGRVTGPMHLPTFPEPFSRPEMSGWFSVQNLQLTQPIGKNFELQLGVKNILNFIQASPLINPQQPFSDSFDTSYNYGPTQGRRYMLGLKYQIK